MPRKLSATASRTAAVQKKVLEHLAESGNISYSCKRSGISRETFYDWKNTNRVFARDADAAIDYGKSFVNDLAHTQLIHNIQQGNMQAVRFQLASCHPDYQSRRPRIPDEEIPIPVATIEITPAPQKSPNEEKSKPAAATTITPPQAIEDGEA